MATTIERYGAHWPAGLDALQIELGAIRQGGQWKNSAGAVCGLGMFQHYKNAQKLLWPEQDHHRWSDLTLSEILKNKVTVFTGPQNSNKTFSAAKYGLVDYWAWPECTCILVSSTDVRGLEMRVWGKMKDLINQARDRYDHLPGVILESLHAFATDEIEEDEGGKDKRGRVLTRGIICIPCLAGGKYVGLGKYVGIKQKRVRLLADEAQLMGQSFLDGIANLGGNQDFKAVIMGNPNDPMDPLGLAAEPLGGWDSQPEPTKTTVWKTRFPDGVCVNLVGTDSPNNDYPELTKPKFPYLIHKWRIDEIEKFWGKDSIQYYRDAVGVMMSGLLVWRVINRELCRQHKALDKAIWEGTQRTKIYALDAAYGGTGGDRCVGGWVEFGNSVSGGQILRVEAPSIIPVSVRNAGQPEDQIAIHVQRDIERELIPVENVFYDSTGRGTMGAAFARQFKERVPVPVEFGGKASKRPVRHDLFVREEGGQQRHKRCDEHYTNFVTELWFSSRYAIEAEQIRELPTNVMMEGCARMYDAQATGGRFTVESKHDPKARERMKQSPDLYDWFVTAIEGARQRGFKIQKLGQEIVEEVDSEDFLERESREYQELMRGKMLERA